MNQSTPPNQVPGLATLDYVVAEVQNELEDYGPRQRSRLVGLAISGLRDFRLYDQSLTQIAYLTINEAGIATLPPDYVDYISIGQKTNAGNIRDFTLNNKMALDRDTDCGEPTRVINPAMSMKDQNLINSGAFVLAPYWGNNNFVPTYYGIGGGYNTAYYKVDKAANIIIFNGIVPRDEVVLVYKSTGVSVNTLVPQELIEPIKAWVHYKRVEYDMRVPMNTKELYAEELRQARMKLRAFTQKFTISEYLDHCVYRNKKQSPRP